MKVLPRNLYGGPEENKNSSVRISGRSTEIWNELLPNTNVAIPQAQSLSEREKATCNITILPCLIHGLHYEKVFSPFV
jgi:hypothetical protein